ncbi:novobiocin biosynthesis protein H-like [Glandiceps talaboti]
MSILRGPKVPPPYGLPANNIHRCFEHLVKHDGSANQRTAVIFEGKKTTYVEFNHQANALARVIKDRLKISKKPLQEPLCIGLHINPSDTVLKFIFAVLKLGAAYLPLDPKYPAKRLQYTITDSSPCCVITASEDGRFIEMMSDIPEEDKPVVLPVDDLLASMEAFPVSDLEESEQIIRRHVDSSTLACILYTSGSTGLPKGVLIPHRSILHRANSLWSAFHTSESDIFCLKSSINFSDSLTEIFGSMLRGIPLAIAPACAATNPELMIKTLDDNKVTWIILVPTLLQTMITILKNKPYNERINMLQSVKMFACAGENVSPQLIDRFHSLLPNSQVTNMWGMTETAGDHVNFVVDRRVQDMKNKQISIGKPIQNTNIYLLDENMKPVPVGETGMCYMSGPSVTDGYLVKDDTGKVSSSLGPEGKFSPNPFEADPEHRTLLNSGDYMRLVLDETTKELNLMFEGRRDTLVKYHGFRIDLNEVGRFLCEHPDIERAVVRCHDQQEEKYLVAYYKVLGDNLDCTPESITKYLRSVLPAYMIPRVVCIDDFPTLPNGKTDNNTLYQKFKQDCIGRVSLEPSDAIALYENSPHARVIQDTVSSVLDLPFEISLLHNYFQMGGNSVNAIEVIMRIRENGFELDIEDFFRAKTLADLLKSEPNKTEQDEKLVSEEFNIPGYEILILNEATDDEFENGCRMGAEAFANSEPATKALEIPTKEKVEVSYSKIKSLAKVNTGISFFVRRQSDNKIVAMSINRDMFDVTDESSTVKECQIRALFSLSTEIHQLAVMNLDLKQPKELFFMDLSAVSEDEEVAMKASLQKLLEAEKIRVSRRHGYKGCCAAYSNPVGAAIAREMGHVELLSSGYIRDHEYDGKKYFTKVQPPDAKHVVLVKYH